MTNLNSKIQWTDATWSPVTGCTKVSSGCDHCYAESITERLNGKGSFAEVKLHYDRLDAPLRWRKPRRVFVNSMSDLFHSDVPDEFITRVWGVMAATPQHTYQILTKRHGRMRTVLRSGSLREAMEDAIAGESLADTYFGLWPLPNVWLGVSVEDQRTAKLRIPVLLDTPARVRFLSCEPLLAPIDLSSWLGPVDQPPCWDDHPTYEECSRCIQPEWVIIGGESGPNARPMDLEWARSLVKQCQDAGVSVFVKQLGSHWARRVNADVSRSSARKGGDPSAWPEDLRVREFPSSMVEYSTNE